MIARKKLREILERHRSETQTFSFNTFPPSEDDIINKLHNKAKSFDGLPQHQSYGGGGGAAAHSSTKKAIKYNFARQVSSSTAQLITDYGNLDTFHRAVRPIFLLAQFFGVLPIVGTFSSNPQNVRFKYASLQMLLVLIYLSSNGLIFSAMLKHLTNLGIDAKNFVGLAFFSCAELSCVLFVILAKRWPKLIQNWTQVEMIFVKEPYEQPKRNLKRRVRSAAFTLIALAFIEHMLSQLSAVISYKRRVNICAQAQNISQHVSFDEYISSNYDYVFSILQYNTAAGIFILASNGVSTFIWNYMDIFIMMVSQGIAYRFEQIMMRINKVANQNVSERTFVEIRTHYVQVCELLDNVDEHLAEIILLSCINNLYFVCYQLLNIFNKLRWPINHIYFWYSLLYLIGRTAFVFLTAASINDESKSALSALRSISHRAWCVEVERLIFQMTTQTVALSGKKFYFMTRRLLFGMAGTIVTYELVLLQFDEPNRSRGLQPLCGK